MKVRLDYVTNSSSSSFLLAFRSKEDGVVKISKAYNKLSSDALSLLLRDFLNAKECTKEDYLDVFCNEIYLAARQFFFRLPQNIGRDKKETSDAFWDWYESPSHKEFLDRYIETLLSDLSRQYEDRPYRVILNYGDHSSLGSELEHDFLGSFEGTIKVTSYH